MTRHTKKTHSRKRIHREKPHTKRASVSQTASNDTPVNVVVVGKIYANWCGHCTALIPEWKKMVEFIETKLNTNKKSNTKYVFSEIEQSEQDAGISEINNTYLQQSSEKLALQDGFPTLFKINSGKVEYYNGDRQYLEMLRWYTSSNIHDIDADASKSVTDKEIPILSKYEGGKTRKSYRKYSRKSNKNKRGFFSFLF